MDPRSLPYLKALIVVLAAGLVLVTGALVRFIVIQGGPRAGAPRTELERAVFAAAEAVKANPDDPTARVKLAAAYLEQDRVDAALEQARIAVRMAPGDPGGYYALGLAQSRAGDLDEAAKSLKKAATTEGQVASFYQDAFTALAAVQERAGDTTEAIRSLTRGIQKGPENALLLYARGRLHEATGSWLFALDDYSAALAFVPTYKEARDGYERVAKAHPDAVKQLEKAGSTGKNP